MAKVKLFDVAIARSGDKGDGSNIGIMANTPALYDYFVENLTTEVVKNYFSEICFGEVDRYELPNLQSLNFILHDSLGGGGTETFLSDAQGKCHGTGLLHLEMEIPDSVLNA